MARPRHPWAEAAPDDFDVLDNQHGMKGLNYEMDEGRWDPTADDGEGEGESNIQDRYHAVPYRSTDYGDA